MARRASNRFVRKAIREIIEPQIVELGFTGKYPDFRRDWNGETHFLSFSSAKYGGSFGYTGAWRKRIPFLEGDHVPLPPDEVTLAHTSFDDRASAVHIIETGLVDSQRMAWRSQGNFHYEAIVDDEDACRMLVKDAAAVLPRLDHWLKTREPSLAIDCKGHRMRQAESALAKWHRACSMVGQFDLNAEMPSTPHSDADRIANEAPEYFVG
ncbi:hypothetical protein BPTFM16_00769 [Altererythrobacter insulae]|nr:hypothetical protein BPTFM16_00769 [Altererythrobacter insulae]